MLLLIRYRGGPSLTTATGSVGGGWPRVGGGGSAFPLRNPKRVRIAGEAGDDAEHGGLLADGAIEKEPKHPCSFGGWVRELAPERDDR